MVAENIALQEPVTKDHLIPYPIQDQNIPFIYIFFLFEI